VQVKLFDNQIGGRLKAIRKSLGLNQGQLADIFKIKQGAVSKIENGTQKIDAYMLSLLVEKYDIRIKWLLSGIDSEDLSNTPKDCDFTQIPLVDVQLSEGNGSFVTSEEVKEYYQFRKDWLTQTVTSSKNAILVGVTGNSMEPTIYNGDVVMIDTGRTHIYEGEMYALRMDNTVMIKRLSHRPGDKVIIMSDNKKEYPPYETERKNIHVLAQVVWYARTLVKTDAYR
jgi:transcriptional regulator with XRE-family HTH domain